MFKIVLTKVYIFQYEKQKANISILFVKCNELNVYLPIKLKQQRDE